MQVPWASDAPLRRWLVARLGVISRLLSRRQVTVELSTSSDPAEDAPARASRRLREHLKLKETEAAIGVYLNARRTVQNWLPSEREYLELVQGVIGLAQWEVAVSLLQDYLDHSRNPDVRVRLKLAQILIRHRSRPAKALEVLDAIPPRSLPESLESTRAELTRRAEAMIAEGVLEIDEDRR